MEHLEGTIRPRLFASLLQDPICGRWAEILSFLEHFVGVIRPSRFAFCNSRVTEWSLSCNECNEAFVQEYSLKNHIECEDKSGSLRTAVGPLL